MERQIDLGEKFPGLQPISGPPKLFRVNGCGPAVYGRRDVDPETNTYVKTLCLAFLFVPVLALRAYRVADAQTGWYFLGREPLSRFARGWNTSVLALALVLSGAGLWNSYYGSETVQAARKPTLVRSQADDPHPASRLAEILLAGRDGEARSLLQGYAQRGVPLPFDP